MTSAVRSPKRLRFAVTILAIVAAVAVAYRGSLSNGFVYDDRFLVTDNALLHRPFDVTAIFGSSFWEHTPLPSSSYYRPLVITSLAVDATLGGFKPRTFHLTNLVLHLANTALVAVLVRALSGTVPVAAGAALLFGLHPINTEPVLWVVGRCDLLALFFGLSALVLFVDDRSRVARRCPPSLRWLSSALALFLALLSKEGAVAVFAMMCAHELLFDPARRRRVRKLLPPAAAVASYLAIRMIVIGPSASGSTFLGNPLLAEGPLVRVWTTLELFGRYTAKLLVPWHLSVDYAFDSIGVVRSPWTPTVVASLPTLVGAVALAWRSRDRLPLIAFGTTMFLGSAGVVLVVAFVGGGAIFAERYMYMASAGFVVACCAALEAGATRIPVSVRGLAAGIVVLLLGGASFARIQARVPEWRDNLTLFQAAVATVPNNAMAHNNLAYAHWQRGELPKARIHCTRALEIYPAFANPLMCLGDLALASGSPEQALEYFRSATVLGHPDGYLSLGEAYIALGRYEQARRALLAGSRTNPSQARYLTQLGVVAWKLGQTEAALEYWRHAVRMNPGESFALFHLGTYYERRDEPGLARDYYRRFLALDPPGLDLYKMYARRALGRGAGSR